MKSRECVKGAQCFLYLVQKGSSLGAPLLSHEQCDRLLFSCRKSLTLKLKPSFERVRTIDNSNAHSSSVSRSWATLTMSG